MAVIRPLKSLCFLKSVHSHSLNSCGIVGKDVQLQEENITGNSGSKPVFMTTLILSSNILQLHNENLFFNIAMDASSSTSYQLGRIKCVASNCYRCDIVGIMFTSLRTLGF
ncbi:hypothetical protein YC2023_069146 [Brassica napus]